MTFLIAFYIIVNVIDYTQNLRGLSGIFVINSQKISFFFTDIHTVRQGGVRKLYK